MSLRDKYPSTHCEHERRQESHAAPVTLIDSMSKVGHRLAITKGVNATRDETQAL